MERAAPRAGDLDAVLATKTVVPRVRARLLGRPALSDRLDRAVSGQLTLVSAPAGFGKTTLLAEWVPRAPAPVAWLSLDADDNDPVRFLRYVVAAIRRVEEGFGERLAAVLAGPDRPALGPLGAILVNELAATTSDLVLILDDYHVIESREVHGLLVNLTDHLPVPLHLVISSRTDPPLPLARLRARGKLEELRVADLRIAPAHVPGYFGEVWGLDLPVEIIELVGSRTEGWVAGLQLAALALRDTPDAAAFAEAFTGTHRFVLDFLSEEVLERQPEDVREFLIETSVLERVGVPLADAVTGRQDSGRMLERLERANLFVVPLDQHRRWYRYHQLFADVLRARLRRDGSEREVRLHRRAAAWCEEQGMVDEAIRHWLGGRDPHRAAALVERHVEELILRTGERVTMDRWFHSLPDDVLQAHPRLPLAQGIAALVEGRVEDVEPLVQMAESAGPAEGSHEPSVGRRASVLHNVPAAAAVARAAVARLRGDAGRTEHFARRALTHLTPEDETLGCFARSHLALADWMRGRLPEAERGLQEVMAERRLAGERYFARACYDLGLVQLALGKLRAAAATYRQAIEIVAGPRRVRPPAAGVGVAGLAEVRRERGDVEGALADAVEGTELCRHLADVQPLSTALVTLACIRQGLGDHEGAMLAIDEAVGVVPSEAIAPLQNLAHSTRVRLLLAQGRLDEAILWVEGRGLSDDDEVPFAYERDYLVLARVLVARGAARQARRLLERIEARAEAEGRIGDLIGVRVLHALALDADDEHDRALGLLSKTVSLARRSGQVAAFSDEGPAIGALLQRLVVAARRGTLRDAEPVSPEFLARLIRACHVATAPGVEGPTISPPAVVEPLTTRETEVLRLLAAGRANREIASDLYVTLATVKKHVTHICQKLGAANRTQAVVYARELGLIR